MTWAFDVASVALVSTGLVFLFGGTVGLVRLPDLFARAHAASKCDAVGAGAILAGLVLHGGIAAGDAKLLLVMALLLVTGPTTAHALLRSAHRTGLLPWRRPGRDAT